MTKNTTQVIRLKAGDGNIWREAVNSLVPQKDRDGALLTPEESEAALADDRCYLLVAQSDAKTVGLLSAFRFPDVEGGGHLVYLYDIEVAASYRRQGLGKVLVNKLLSLCDQDDVDLIWAGTEGDNHAARATFESTGGRLDSETYAEYEWDLEEE